MDTRLYPHTTLLSFAFQVFRQMGCLDDHARMAADNLLAADLRGIDSHGVARLSGYYRLFEAGRLKGDAAYRIVHETPSTALLDAGAGLGLVSAQLAMETAIQKAQAVGSGWVSVRNSNHFGIAGRYALMAARQGMIGFAFTNASPLVAPARSNQRMLGTNPIAVAIPAGKYPPLVADMATTAAANGKLEILQRKQKPAPEGWILDKDGRPTTDPTAPGQGGSLLPLGSDAERAYHKGYALGAVVDILSGVLGGSGFGPWVPPFVAFLQPRADAPHPGLGHLMGALRVDAFRPSDEFEQDMETWIEAFRDAPALDAAAPVLIPGQPEHEAEQERLENGIPLIGSVVEDLKALAGKVGVSFATI